LVLVQVPEVHRVAVRKHQPNLLQLLGGERRVLGTFVVVLGRVHVAHAVAFVVAVGLVRLVQRARDGVEDVERLRLGARHFLVLVQPFLVVVPVVPAVLPLPVLATLAAVILAAVFVLFRRQHQLFLVLLLFLLFLLLVPFVVVVIRDVFLCSVLLRVAKRIRILLGKILPVVVVVASSFLWLVFIFNVRFPFPIFFVLLFLFLFSLLATATMGATRSRSVLTGMIVMMLGWWCGTTGPFPRLFFAFFGLVANWRALAPQPLEERTHAR